MAVTETTIEFAHSNPSLQVSQNFTTINAEIHFPPVKVMRPLSAAG